MVMRMLQISCLLVLGLLVRSSNVDARWEGPCTGKHCTTCDDPNPSGDYCWVDTESCHWYGCTAFAFCGPGNEYVECECEPCITR